MNTSELLLNIADKLKNNIDSSTQEMCLEVNKIIYELEQFGELVKVVAEHETKTVLEEAQNDLMTSLLFACQGFYRNSYMCLRSSIELLLSFIYYYDHQYDFILWKNNHIDMRWGTLIDVDRGVFNNNFLSIINSKDINSENLKTSLRQLYHETSESVHGKYLYMQVLQSDSIQFKKELFLKYYTTVLSILEKSSIIIYLRFNTSFIEKLDAEHENSLNSLLKQEGITNE